jgi:hypothetical protein
MSILTKKVRRVQSVTLKLVRGKEETMLFKQVWARGYEVRSNEDVIAEVETHLVEEPLFSNYSAEEF